MSTPSKKMKEEFTEVDETCVNNIRTLAADVVQKANSGHPGAPMGCAPMAHVLFTRSMRYNPSNPLWFNRDRFVLSNGHACALLYSMLHLTGFPRPTMDDLKSFRQLDSVCPGHPERGHGLDGVEVTTGPLGQGIANAVGLAMAEKHLAAVFNKPDLEVVDHFTFAICGDGCLQEGVSMEASSLAGHLGLGKLIILYDDNNITIDGEIALSFTEDVAKRYESYGFRILSVERGDSDLAAIHEAVEFCKQNAHLNKPSLIKIKTTIGYGASKAGTDGVHGAPLGNADIEKVKQKFGFPPQEIFYVKPEVQSEFAKVVAKGKSAEAEWQNKFVQYQAKYPELAKEFTRRATGQLPDELATWEKAVAYLPKFPHGDKAIASRNSSEKVLNAVANKVTELVGGSADLTGSNKTALVCTHDFQTATPDGRYVRFGVREHGMAAICNGISAHGSLLPFCATFLNFVGYALGAMRLSALSKSQVLYIMSHDSIGLGEDGPTHQPVETFIHLRSIPNMYFFRPADGAEVVGSYVQSLYLRESPSVIATSRQDLPCLAGTNAESVKLGGYVIQSVEGKPDLVLVSSGSEVHLCVAAAELLNGVKVQIVSMPCMDLFVEQSQAYHKQCFPENVPVVSVEAAGIEGWAKYSHVQLGLRTFGASAPIKDLYKKFGLNPDQIAAKAKQTLEFYKGKHVPWLVDQME
ncbi:transketolase [Batrachochytrium salamandrivorans]|nr:transketolase [Batrachochytrium salamandrivorans]